MVYLLVVVGAVILIAAIAYGTQRKSRDGVASFKRQIDALSPEARKPVVDQVQSVSDLRRSSESTTPGSGTPRPGASATGTAGAEGSNDTKAADPADTPGEPADGA